MVKQSLETPSWQKQLAKDKITIHLARSVNYYRNTIEGMISQFMPDVSIKTHNKKVLYAAIPKENLEEFKNMYEVYDLVLENYAVINWYVNKLFTSADSLETLKKAIPEFYHQYITGFTPDGEATLDMLYNAKCFNILEQAPISNLILGINEA